MKISYISKVTLFVLILLINTGAFSEDLMDCYYAPKPTKQNLSPEITAFKKCGYIDKDEHFTIADRHLKNLHFDKNQPATVYCDKKVYYVNKTGNSMRALFFDNGADYFSENLARTIQKGKIGYFNKKLEIIIPSRFDFGFPFANGKAIVCNGCSAVKIGEHSIVQGGKWGMINRKGLVIVPIKYTEDEVLKMK